MRKIGLTGGIASGKSTVAGMLRAHGAAIIDADLVGHEVYRPDQPAWRALVEAFGQQIVAEDSTIDRRRLGGLVFNDAAQMKRLTDIVWPSMKELIRARLHTMASGDADVAVLEAAVLFEAGWQDLVDEVWVVTVPPAVAVERLVARNALSPEQARARLDSQLSNEERVRGAYLVIDNAGSVEDLGRHVFNAWQALQDRVA